MKKFTYALLAMLGGALGAIGVVTLGTAIAQQGIEGGVEGGAGGGGGLDIDVVQGDLIYGSDVDMLAALTKNTTATRYLSNTGTSNNPAWAAVNLANGVTGTLPAGNGGLGITTVTDDNTIVANGTVWQTKAIPDCDDSAGSHLNYDTTTNAFSCGTSTSGAAATTGSFTLSFDDACTSTSTVTVNWARNGNHVMWRFPGLGTCTGDSTSFRATGDEVPAALRPAADIVVPIGPVVDNSATDQFGCMRIFNSGGGNAGDVDILRTSTTGALFGCDNATWTASGNRRFAGSPAVGAQIIVHYLLN